MTKPVVVLGYMASPERVQADPALSFADDRLQWNYVRALGLVRPGTAAVSTVDARPAGRLARWRSVWRDLGGRLRGGGTVLVYNTLLPQLLLARAAQIVHGARAVPISITRPYRFGGRASLAYRVQDALAARLLRRMDGAIAITPQLAREMRVPGPSLVVRGGVWASEIDTVEPTPAGGPRRIVYAGTLYERYHLLELTEAVEQLAGDVELHIFGRGPLLDDLRARASGRVIVHGPVPREEVQAALATADVIVATLRVDDFATVTFPSKIFESLASGNPVVTTDLPTLDAGLRSVLQVAHPTDVARYADELSALLALSPAERADLRARTLDYLEDHATWEALSRTLDEFLTTVEAPRGRRRR